MNTPTRYWLPTHIRISPNPSGAVLLDLQRNRYIGIGLKETQAIARVAANLPYPPGELPQQPMEESLAIAGLLTEAGLLSTHEPHQPPLGQGQIDLDGHLSSVGHEIEVPRAMRPGHVMTFARACLWARWVLKRRSLFWIAQSLAQRKHAAGATFQLDECAGSVSV